MAKATGSRRRPEVIEVHPRIGIGCPDFALRDPKVTLEEVSGRIARWEILAEDNCALPQAQPRFEELQSSFDVTLQVHAPFSDLNPASVNPAARRLSLRVLEDTIGSAGALGMELVTVHPGIVTPMGQLRKETSIGNNIDSFRALAAVADDSGVRLALENMPFPVFTLCNTYDEIGEVLDAAGAPDALGFCLDVGHGNITGENIALTGLRDRLFNIHLHDNDGRRDQHLALGEGTADIQGVLKRLLPGYKGPFTIEGKGTTHVCGSQETLGEMLSSIPGWDD